MKMYDSYINTNKIHDLDILTSLLHTKKIAITLYN